MSDIDRAANSIHTAEVKEFAERFIRGVLNRVKNAPPPCAGHECTPWTEAIFATLKEMGENQAEQRYVYAWLLDRVWWSKKNAEETMLLGVESELQKNVEEIEGDFQKLPSLKCLKKLLVFSSDNPEQVRQMAESYLTRFTQHSAGEEYYLIGFTADGPCCYFYCVPEDGKQSKVRFKPLEIRLQD